MLAVDDLVLQLGPSLEEPSRFLADHGASMEEDATQFTGLAPRSTYMYVHVYLNKSFHLR